jgi:hypothetical protein
MLTRFMISKAFRGFSRRAVRIFSRSVMSVPCVRGLRHSAKIGSNSKGQKILQRTSRLIHRKTTTGRPQKTSVHEFMDFMILNVCPLLPPCPVLAVPFLRRMHWFAAKLFLESLSVGLFSKHEHPIVLILPGDGVTVAREGKFMFPAEVPELVVILPDALVFVSATQNGAPRSMRRRCCQRLTGNAARSGRC